MLIGRSNNPRFNRQPFWIKQAVRCCRQCGVAGGQRVPLAQLGWFFVKQISMVSSWSLNLFLSTWKIPLKFKLYLCLLVNPSGTFEPVRVRI